MNWDLKILKPPRIFQKWKRTGKAGKARTLVTDQAAAENKPEGNIASLNNLKTKADQALQDKTIGA